ncbi:putative aspartokinase [Colletotrichum fructicola]|uniref:Aspartokinase n=1 Tax=Colletotrichum fructicola (strain Nara gc5) TaxID=1213859 RepID=L2FPT0_COLFN|nr:putative aspartokinase [Colletotrichum fructicola]KAF4476651.1 putative aspartokinase [Colletotrichum fructicola Nara gc5]KAE9567140.1 putative aspartokinase [Colletotrichum fructicola]KAF4419354.1 putative aspartokinase [Colletotrichum fructicola]KAF4904056.1 putative aspartokinase [Colletotrichum fructicola]KAF4926071.1 putative aspartokinase [Colletotrichum fructicola]
MATGRENRPWLVQKYGGTSLGKLLESICSKIIPSYLQDHNLVVVCSALSGSTKASGTTSLLLECISHAEAGLPAQAQLNKALELVRDNHVRLLEKHLVNSNGTRSDLCSDIFDTTKNVIIKECESLRGFLLAAQIIGELSPRARDRVVALGEKLACRVVAAYLSSKGVPAEPVILEDVVESVFGGSIFEQKTALDNLGPRFYHLLGDEITRRIRECGDHVPIVTGFFGIMPDSLLKNVGRGYSDPCAAMCAVGTKATELQIWKEVDGIFTADPRKVPSARLLSTVTAEEATELTYYGSEVIHPLTMDQIRCANIPLRLKNVFNPTGAGTIIYPSRTPSPPLTPPTPTDEKVDVKVPLPSIDFMLGNGYHGDQKERRRPTAVTVKDSILLVNVVCNRNTKSQGFLSGVFDRLEEAGIKTDLVTTSERNVSLAFQHSEEGSCQHQRLRVELEKFGKVVITENMSIVTVIGHKMRNMVGISAEIMSALAAAKINIFLVSQGASEINVSLVVRAEDSVLAMNVIHSKVLRIPTHWEQENNFIKGPWLY